jgi:hypothetical protein
MVHIKNISKPRGLVGLLHSSQSTENEINDNLRIEASGDR